MKYIHETYDSNKYPIYITENGISSAGNGTDIHPELDDQARVYTPPEYLGVPTEFWSKVELLVKNKKFCENPGILNPTDCKP